MPGGAASALQAANPAIGTVARSPQTTVTPVSANAPFIRQSRQAQQLGFSVTGQAFGALITQQLSAVGGYLRGLLITITATTGAGTTTVALQPDAPWNVIATLQFKDPTGQPIYQIDGFSLYLVQLFSGMCGQGGGQNPAVDPVYSAPTTGASASGNFTLRYYVPLEFDSAAYCCLADMNAAAQPLLSITLVASGSFYSTAPNTTVPVMQVQVNELFWTIPQGNPTAAPPDIGSSCQWTVVNGGQNPTSSANLRVQHPSPGTFIHTLICVLRDSTNARIAKWPTSDLTLWLDNVPLLFELFSERQRKVYQQFAVPLVTSDQGVANVTTTTPFTGNVNTTGVIAYSFRSSVQDEVSQADNHDLLLSTTPATKLEIGGTFQSGISNSPAQVQFITGWLFPANPAAVPYTHLAN